MTSPKDNVADCKARGIASSLCLGPDARISARGSETDTQISMKPVYIMVVQVMIGQ